MAIVTNGSTGSAGGSQPWLEAVTQITDAQIKALKATDVEIIDPPGVGKAILVQSFDIVLDARNGAYSSGGSPELDLGFATHWVNYDTNGLRMDTATLQAGSALLANGSDGAQFYGSIMHGGALLRMTDIANVPFCIGNIGDAEWEGGGAGNTISVRVFYRIVVLTPFTS